MASRETTFYRTFDQYLIFSAVNLAPFEVPSTGPFLAITDNFYLAFVLDLFRRKIVVWSMNNSLATELITDAMRRAVQRGRFGGDAGSSPRPRLSVHQ
jgi:transposase InsO family protein